MQKLSYDAAFPFSILGENGELVAYCDDDGISEIDRKDAARRIVACVNACSGIPLERLEQVPPINAAKDWVDTVLQWKDQRDELQLERDNYKSVAEAHSGAFQECIRLREQRDELLNALEIMLNFMGMDEIESNTHIFTQARKAIAKVQK